MAIANKGGAAALQAVLGEKSIDEHAKISDYCWLSQIIKRRVPAGFETNFKEFVLPRLAMCFDDELDELKANVGMIRNGAKINATIDNARIMVDSADEHGAADRLLAEWPDLGFIGLLALLKKRGGRLGGNTGQYVLRFMGKRADVFSKEGVPPLIRQGVISKRVLSAVQEAFNQWSRETGRDLSQLSRDLAASV
jgi:3-methyladenine DNA glycosylase Tag